MKCEDKDFLNWTIIPQFIAIVSWFMPVLMELGLGERLETMLHCELASALLVYFVQL